MAPRLHHVGRPRPPCARRTGNPRPARSPPSLRCRARAWVPQSPRRQAGRTEQFARSWCRPGPAGCCGLRTTRASSWARRATTRSTRSTASRRSDRCVPCSRCQRARGREVVKARMADARARNPRRAPISRAVQTTRFVDSSIHEVTNTSWRPRRWWAWRVPDSCRRRAPPHPYDRGADVADGTSRAVALRLLDQHADAVRDVLANASSSTTRSSCSRTSSA